MSKEMVVTTKEMIAAGIVAIIVVVILTMIDLALCKSENDTHNMIKHYEQSYEFKHGYEIPKYEI